MEDTKKNEMWGKVMAPLAGFLAIVLAAFLIILKLLESGVIGTVMAMILICVIVAAVFGGIGSIPGAVVGAFIIGICENIIKGLGWTTFSDAFTFALLIVILIVKPTGLFGEKVTDKV